MKRVVKKQIKTSDGKLTIGYLIVDEKDVGDAGSEINYDLTQTEPVYFCKDNITICGYKIEKPLVYIGSNRELDLAIDATKPISNGEGHYYVNYNFISATYVDYSVYERHLYLSWLASDKKSHASEKILTLYFRNLQRRAVIEGQDQNLILFEIVSIFDRYSNKIGHHFGDNYLPLFVYLVFKREAKFSEEEQEILMGFIEKYCYEKYIKEVRAELIFKIKGDEFQSLYPPLLKSNDINERIDLIFEYITTKDIHDSNSKFYKKFNRAMLLRVFRDRPVLYTIFRILLYDNRNILNEENLKPEIREKNEIYKNYYFYSVEKYYYYNIGREIVLNIGMQIKKIFYEATNMTENYIFEIEALCGEKKRIEDEDRYKVLPQLLQDYFKGILAINTALPDNRVDVLKWKIDGRTITERMRMCFKGLGIKTCGDLVQKTGKELLKFEGFGQSSLKEVKYYLEVFGLSLREEEQIIKRKKNKNTVSALDDIRIEFSIDKEKLSRIKEDTIGIKNVLTEIFIDEEEGEKVATKENSEDLDKKYVDFIEFVKEKKIWTKKELSDYCKNNKLMLNSAISTINEYWDEKYGEYLLEEEEGGFVVNDL
jgi:hypothetical protein